MEFGEEMQRKGSIIIAVLALLALMAVVWLIFRRPASQVKPAADSNAAGNHEHKAQVSLAPTKINVYVPSRPPASVPTRKGSCWTGSIAAPFRKDAWRCMAGNAISDPCFEMPGSRALICGANPAKPDSSSAFILQLTKPLPAPEPAHGPAPSDWAWRVELSDGTICWPFTGTRPVTADGLAAKYGCAPKSPGAKGLLIFGDFTVSGSTLLATVCTLSQSGSGLPTIATSTQAPVATLWQ